MIDSQIYLQQLHQTRNALLEKTASYIGAVPASLQLQIDSHTQAIELTEAHRRGELTAATWQVALKPLQADLTAGRQIAFNQPSPQTPVPAGSASPQSRPLYAIGGMLVGVMVNIAINLLSSAIEQNYLANQLGLDTIWGMVIFIGLGLLLGWWLSGPVAVPAESAPHPADYPTAKPAMETITRLKALFSYAKLRGKGIRLSDILLIGAKLDIDTRSDDDPSHH